MENIHEFENIPKIDKVKQSIRKLKQTEFPRYNGENVEDFVSIISNILEREFNLIPNIKQPFKCNSFLTKFFRARELDAISSINFIREHSYPPIDIVGMGRCNFPKYPVFYCSNNAFTALIEVIKNYKNKNKKFCISKWELIKTEEELLFESFLQVELPKENNFNMLKEKIQEKINLPFEKSFNQKLDKEREEGLLEYLKYLDSCFISDNNYSLSATLAYRALYANHNFRTDVLMYPSVQTLFKGVNLAMQPNFVENNLKLTRLYIVELDKQDLDSGKINLTFYKYAEVEKNIIMWKEISENLEHYHEIIKEDFGEEIE
ncbi:MAG TPA: hypothetical protein PLH91_05220 [Tenuifilaceae bacterium]|nr:hypothetical protein [Tenuifilaceae bacterium]HOZ14974.1 hypothetical protein [Tenuifilaceae bacterium]HPI44609.1 hypothetical protein [Tenuifilaceae bacterium]HPN20775.1 hypothetical protein [Tenuifilaceae bacterium]